jgi:hypothetical protein
MAPRRRGLPLILSPGVLLTRRAMREGLRGDSKVWRLVLVAIVGRRLLRKLMGSDPATVAIERLQPGETLILRGVTTRKLSKR